MKQSMKKAALVLMLALVVLLVPQWSNTALAVTTPSDITTGSDLPPAPPLPLSLIHISEPTRPY